MWLRPLCWRFVVLPRWLQYKKRFVSVSGGRGRRIIIITWTANIFFLYLGNKISLQGYIFLILIVAAWTSISCYQNWKTRLQFYKISLKCYKSPTFLMQTQKMGASFGALPLNSKSSSMNEEENPLLPHFIQDLSSNYSLNAQLSSGRITTIYMDPLIICFFFCIRFYSYFSLYRL